MLNKSTSEDILRFAFNVFDLNKDGNIDRVELGCRTFMHIVRAIQSVIPSTDRSLLRTAFTSLTEQQLQDLFDRVDSNGDGAITYGADQPPFHPRKKKSHQQNTR